MTFYDERPSMTKAFNSAWINLPKPNASAKVRLFCFPYAGGGVFEYRVWAACLPAAVEIGAVQLPGRETRLGETPFTRIRALCETLAAAMTPFLNKPFAFYGHSLGALIAFELIRELRRAGSPLPKHLLVSGARAPQLPSLEPPVYHLPDDELIREVNARYGGIPAEVLANGEMLELLLPMLRADFAMHDTYVYYDDLPLDCPIACFGGQQDASTPLTHLEAWRDQTRNTFAQQMFGGDHFFIRSARAPLLQAVSAHLNQVV